MRMELSVQASQEATERKWLVLSIDRDALGAVRSVELIARENADRGLDQYAFRLPGGEFRVFCSFAGLRPDDFTRAEARQRVRPAKSPTTDLNLRAGRPKCGITGLNSWESLAPR